ncbi:hypothetical protein K438DRAFT_800639 [Mycena galopus ATCC 62051]|nr:hypothetical protein K438DRAFT_800639 [Mycena galopus ATCC 62051]
MQASRMGETDRMPSRRLGPLFCIAACAHSGHPWRAHTFALSCTREMHRKHPHCPPPTSAFCSSTISDAMPSVTTMPIAVRSTQPALTTSPLTPCPQHQAPVHPRYDTQQTLWFLDACAAPVNRRRSNDQCSQRVPACTTTGMGNTSARCVHSPSHTPFSLPPARDVYLRQYPSLPRLSFSRSPKYHPHAPLPACGALAGLFTIDGATFFSAHYHPRCVAPPPPWSTIDAGAPPHARHAVPPACAALDAVRVSTTKRLSSRTHNA